MKRILTTLLLATTAVWAADVKEREPGPKSKGGLVYRYYIPKKYSAEKGANLTFPLHGSKY